MKLIFATLLFFFLFGHTTLFAAPLTGCHCFRHRHYDPVNRYVADDYLLATCFNSLISSSFGIAKGEIIMKRMKGGVSGDDLVIGLYVSARTTKPLSLLLAIRDNGGSWQKILESVETGRLADPILGALRAGHQPGSVFSMITGTMLVSRYHCSREMVIGLREQHFTDREINVVLVLAEQAGASMDQVADMYRQKKMSWSEIAHHFRMTPRELGNRVFKKIR